MIFTYGLVSLLLEVLPEVFVDNCFVLKGGTAINLFVQNMPRLSVDIDLTYVNFELPRNDALIDIRNKIREIKKRVSILGADCVLAGSADARETKLFIRKDGVEVKIEVNFVIRGTILPPVKSVLVEKSRQMFSREITVPILHESELYAGKLVAALDRQHPRDIFDVMMMFRMRETLVSELMDCLICYLISHDGSLPEVLFSKDKDLGEFFETHFVGMSFEQVSLSDLNKARAQLREEIKNNLLPRHKEFLLSVALCEPKWDLMPFSHLKDLPAVKWKLQNLEKLKKSNLSRFRRQAEGLKAKF